MTCDGRSRPPHGGRLRRPRAIDPAPSSWRDDAGGPDTLESPHVVRADAEKLRQVLLNLPTDAVKFTDAGGRVALACEADAGRGIPADQPERVFEPFGQVDRHRTHASPPGVGPGLAISRDLAVESTPGAGSTFTLARPLA